MNNLWNAAEADTLKNDLELRVYSSRLLGRDGTLVLHGGGNTSVKITETNLLGEEESILYVKGSGWDLETIEAAGFSPVRLHHLQRLAELPELSDPAMVNELATHMTRSSAPAPSVEAILHAILPFKFVDHTHADAVVTVTNSVDGEKRIREIYGEDVLVIPYIMPGFDLAKLCAKAIANDLRPGMIGMVLLNHGIFSFGETAKESYDRMIALVGRAETYLKNHNALPASSSPAATPPGAPAMPATPAAPRISVDHAELRRAISETAGFPVILARYTEPEVPRFIARSDLAEIAQQGPATPDHVIRTKRLPLIGRDVNRYAKEYQAYFNENEPRAKERKVMLDPAPRVVLDRELGLCTAGRSAKDAGIVADIYRHTMGIIESATTLGGYRALPTSDLFDMEYWDLEQAKLRRAGAAPRFAGEIALVTGAASGIGRACVEALLSRGAAVVGLDIDAGITSLFRRPDFRGIVCDVTDESALRNALDQTVRFFGGLDMLILNAGIFPSGCRVEDLSTEVWKRVMGINLDANLALMRESHPLLKLAPRKGRIVIIGSKNVPAPGPGAGAYSASKAALNQLARVAALEWGRDGIRINSVHPNAVFDTGIWTEEVLKSRAAHYGLTVEEYKTNNVLRTEVTSRDVAELVAEMCGPLFAKTTGAQVPVDGGNERVI